MTGEAYSALPAPSGVLAPARRSSIFVPKLKGWEENALSLWNTLRRSVSTTVRYFFATVKTHISPPAFLWLT
ncbi:hypothetical protein DL769_000159 [Monosporascus sp. CRB-8-3]|nr:hypothetical protein DL769_000159 [Monosporascus sp. CRB-8-3]